MRDLLKGWPVIVALAVAATTVYALNRYAAYSDAHGRLQARIDGLEEAQSLSSAHPEAFWARETQAERLDLKHLVQEAAVRHGVGIVYLNEFEREAGKDLRERSAVCRAVHVPQGSLVKFLAELESRGQGARIKEIRLKPADDQSGVYQEAEATLARRIRVAKPREEAAP